MEPHLPEPAETGRPRTDDRQILNGICWILGTGAPWRDLPERYGPWQTVYGRYRLWQLDGLWDRLLETLQAKIDRMKGLDWDLFFVDGTVVRAHRAAAGARGENQPGH